MSHAPERPKQYVCTDCLVVHVGQVSGEIGAHTFEPPEECGACGAEELVEATQYPHVMSG